MIDNSSWQALFMEAELIAGTTTNKNYVGQALPGFSERERSLVLHRKVDSEDWKYQYAHVPLIHAE